MGNDKITIGERIEDLLKQNNMTSKELSDKVTAAGIKLSPATLSDIINDVDKGYSYKIFVEIAKQLNISTDYLFGLTNITVSLKADNDTALRISCDYIGLDESTVCDLNIANRIYGINSSEINFYNKIIKFLNKSIFEIEDYFYYIDLLQKSILKYKKYFEQSDNAEVLEEFDIEQLALCNDIEKIEAIDIDDTSNCIELCRDKILLSQYVLSNNFNKALYFDNITELIEEANTILRE